MKENPTSCSRYRLMYEYVGRRDNWIGGKRPFYVSLSVWVREINHSRERFRTQPRNPRHKSIKKSFEKIAQINCVSMLYGAGTNGESTVNGLVSVRHP